MKARILVVDDHQVVRDGLRYVIRQQPDMEVVGEAANGREALSQAAKLRPDLIVMDLHLSDTTGIVISAQIIKDLPNTKILALTAYPDPEFVKSAVMAGIKGYLLKSNASGELLLAIRTLLAGQCYLCPEVAGTLLSNYRGVLENKEKTSTPLLTKREEEVLVLIAEGLRNKEIADKLGIAPKTAESHRTRLMAKLKCSSPVELAKYAIREGLVSA